jgi:hypothetical protein
MKLSSLVLDCMRGLGGAALIATVGCTGLDAPVPAAGQPAAVLVPLAAVTPTAPSQPPLDAIQFTPIPPATPPVEVDVQPDPVEPRRRRRRQPITHPMNPNQWVGPVRPACGRG